MVPGAGSLANLLGARYQTRTGTHYAADFRTTIVFTTLSVCGLDYTLTVAFALGPCRLVSTRSKVFLLRLRSVLACYSLHRI